ncbi:MAG: NADPH:quinone oxidoreductase [Proteobacteria bacterium]|nr:MAG: NADPH:quinone oxidoreductase [Pseudomonadota bacterium]
MKAMICKEPGGPEKLQLGELPQPKMLPGHVRIKVIACGINFPDTLIIEGKYQAKPELPFAPGAEVSGVVLEVGKGINHLAPGDRVLAMAQHGGLAEEMVAPAPAVIKIPDAMPFEVAAGFILTYGTSYHALKQRAQLKQGETLLVLGAAGGVGLAAVELGKSMGARVIAAASSEEKLAIAREHGADECINYTESNLKEAVKAIAKKGVDVVYDPVGGDLFDAANRCMGWNGRYLVIGFASGRIPELSANLPLLKGYSLMGVFWGNFVMRQMKESMQNNQELLELYQSGALKPLISEVFPLAETAKAMGRLTSRQVKGKVVVKVSEQ